jgi:5-methylcytosine-specific restriction endonuclease McrA
MSNLNDNVLVLNKHWVAVNVASARRIFSLLFQEHTIVLHNMATYNYNQWRELSYGYIGEDVVHTPHYLLRIPSIVLLTRYDKLPHREVRFTRDSIYSRDNYTCQYCHKKFPKSELNIDHVVPKALGGKTVWDNVVCSCVECNTRKQDRTPEQAGMTLLKKPKRPMWKPASKSVCLESIQKPEWKIFLDTAGWAVEVSSNR